jgi:ribosome-associated protein
MNSNKQNNDKTHSNTDQDDGFLGPSKTQVKRDCHHLVDIGDDILKLKKEEIESLELPAELEGAIITALKIKSRSGLKRQRLYIGKLLRSIDNEIIEKQLRKIQHQHDTNTAHFKRLEKWRDSLIDNDKQALGEVIAYFPQIDRQHINQLIRAAHQEKQRGKPPAASRKLFKYLRELEDNKNNQK